MSTRPVPPGGLRNTWAFWAVCGWTVIVTSAGLREYQFYIYWVASLFIAVSMWPRLLTIPSRPVVYVGITGTALVLSIMALAAVSEQPRYEFIEAGKLAVILLVILPIVLARQDTSRGLRAGAWAATIINALLLIAGIVGLSSTVTQTALGRFDTILNPAGSMWRVGVLLLVSSALRLLLTRSSLGPVLMFGCSALLMIFDGSRTGALCMLAAVGFVGWFITREIVRGNRRLSRGLMAGTAVLGAAFVIALLFAPAFQAAGSIGFGDRVGQLYASITGQGGEGLEQVDSVRPEMLRAALAAITSHPLVGTGMGTTRVETPAGPMAVHISYLQVWGDVGLPGFFAFSALMLGSLVGPWARMGRVSGASLEARIEFHNGVFVLFCFAFSGFFHPISTELTEWATFFIGLAGLQAAQWPGAAIGMQAQSVRILPATRSVFGRGYITPERKSAGNAPMRGPFGDGA